MAKVLTSRDDIRSWASARAGNPMVMETPDVNGERTLLQITFGQHALNSDRNEGPDTNPYGGWSLTGWNEWFDELEKQELAIKVNDEVPGQLDNDFRFVPRSEADDEAETTDAAQKPAAITVQLPDPSDHA